MRLSRALAGAALPLLLASGCGEESSVGDNATVTVYAATATCRQATRALRNEGGRAGELRVRVRCVPAVETGGRVDLAQVGENARRASEDSTTVAYIGEIEPVANRFSEAILEEAGIAQLPRTSGSKAMHQILTALQEVGDNESPREAVFSALR